MKKSVHDLTDTLIFLNYPDIFEPLCGLCDSLCPLRPGFLIRLRRIEYSNAKNAMNRKGRKGNTGYV